MRWSITGTSASAEARCSATARSVSSGSKRRRRISVEASGSASVKCAKPQEWNIGAAITVVSRARSGIFENSAAAGSSESGCLRGAPFGVPAGGTTAILPLQVTVDLKQFFQNQSYNDLINLALALSGQGGVSQVQLLAQPTMSAMGLSLKYPGQITIVNTEFRS